MEEDAELGLVLRRAFPGGRFGPPERLAGGISARAVVVSVSLGGDSKRVVVRRPQRDTLEERQRVVEGEHRVLSRCAAFGLPVPVPCFLDRDAAAIVLEHVEGAPDFAPASLSAILEAMAATLARIHSVPVTPELDVLERSRAGLEWQLDRARPEPDLALDEPRIRTALRELWPWEQHNPDVLLHGDYWPGNVLFRQGTLAAVLDWEEAKVGDPLADLALSRLDLAWAYGDDAAHEFTESYARHRTLDWRNLPRWDLAVALRPISCLHLWAQSYVAPPISRPDITEAFMRDGHRRFVSQAFVALGQA